jgi:hypothetical protein
MALGLPAVMPRRVTIVADTDQARQRRATAYPRYAGGERNTPPEDCGGRAGFSDMLDALADPDHPNHADATEWADDYDPYTIDELVIKYALPRIANHRNDAKARNALLHRSIIVVGFGWS